MFNPFSWLYDKVAEKISTNVTEKVIVVVVKKGVEFTASVAIASSIPAIADLGYLIVNNTSPIVAGITAVIVLIVGTVWSLVSKLKK